MPLRPSYLVTYTLCISLFLAPCNPAFSQAKSSARQLPGKTQAGTLLPNGWTLTPEGKQIPVSDLPLNMVMSNDGRYLLVTTNGYGLQTINVIDLTSGQSIQVIEVKKSWLGLAFAPDGK